MLENKYLPNKTRREIISELLNAIMVSGFSEKLNVIGTDGSRPVMVAFEDETIQDVFERISWSQGYSNLFILMADGSMSIASILPQTSAILSDSAESLDSDLDPLQEVGMLVRYAALQGKGLNVRVRLTQNSFSRIDDLVPAPAGLIPA